MRAFCSAAGCRCGLQAIILGLFVGVPLADAGALLPRWEAGIGGGAASMPQYIGSNEHYSLAFPLPYIIYRSDHLWIDRDRITAYLYDKYNLSLEAGLGIGMPVSNSNRARAGMPALNLSLAAGPNLTVYVYGKDNTLASIRLPWRGVMDIKGHYLGWQSEPDFHVEIQASDAIGVELSAGAIFTSQKYNNTYYGVAPVYANPGRPAYRAKAGLHSYSFNTAAMWSITPRLSLFGDLLYRNMGSGVVHNSPLVKSQNYTAATVGLTWSFYQSDERAPADY